METHKSKSEFSCRDLYRRYVHIWIFTTRPILIAVRMWRVSTRIAY